MLLSTLALTLTLALPPQEPKVAPPLDLLRAVPKDAWLFAQVRDLDGLRADLEKNSFWKLYQDEDSAGLRASVDQAMAGEKPGETKPEEDSGRMFLDLVASVHGSLLLYLGAPAKGSEPDVVVIADPGSPRAAFEKFFDRLVESDSKKSIPSSRTYAGVELKLCEQKPAEKSGPEPAPPARLHHSLYLDAGTFAAFTYSTDLERTIELAHATIDRLRGTDTAEGVAASPRYLEARSSASARGRVEVYSDLSRLLPAALADRKVEDADRERFLAASGFAEMRWGYLAADLGAGEQARMELALSLPEKGLLRDLAALLGKLPREAARAMPKESQGVSLYSIDVPGLWKWIWEIVKVVRPAQADASRAQIQAAGQALGGVDIEKDVLGQLTGEFGSNMIEVPPEEWVAANVATGAGDEDEADKDAAPPPEAPKGGSFGQAWWIGLHDTKAFSATLESMLEATGASGQLETEDFQGQTVWSLPSPTGAGTLAFSFTTKGMVISGFPSALRALLRMEGKEAKESVLEREAFKPVFAENPEAGVFSVSHTASMIRAMLGALGMLERQIPPLGSAQNPLAHLPTPEAIDRHFQGTATSTARWRGGVLSVRFSMR
jgi:hypothetical protein